MHEASHGSVGDCRRQAFECTSRGTTTPAAFFFRAWNFFGTRWLELPPPAGSASADRLFVYSLLSALSASPR